MSLQHRISASASGHGPLRRPKRSAWERTKDILPILEWLPKYNAARDLRFDIAAGITVAMMLIPQEVSLAGIMHVPAHNGLYTAATAPLVYALFGSSTVLSVASGSEVSLLVGSALADIESEEERVATGVFMAFFIGLVLLLVRFLNLSQIADFFSRPVMGGFISAGGFLIGLSQVPNWLSVKVEHATYPPQTVYKIFAGIKQTEKYSFTVGLVSILFLIALKLIKKRYFPNPVTMRLFEEDSAKKLEGNEEIPTPVTLGSSAPAAHHGHGFSLTDQQYVSMAAERAVDREEKTNAPPKEGANFWLHFIARTLCDLGPLMVCIVGGVIGWVVGPKKMKLTGNVPGGFPEPLEPWYGFSSGIIDNDRLGSIIVDALMICVVVYLSSIAMAKRLAIQRGEDIRTDQELMGLGVAAIVCGFFRAMPPTGGMSRTAVNLQNARTQLASIITVSIIIISLYTLTGALKYLPKSSLAAIIIVAGYSLVEFKEAKWLYRVKRDEFYVWAASFILTLGLGVQNGLFASIVCSVVALMWKTKRAPVAFLAELDNGSLVDREFFPDAKPLLDVVAVRVEASLYFANCERMVSFVEEELSVLASEGVQVRGVVFDAYHINDMDATTIQVLSDLQEKLAVRKIGFAIANAKGRIHDVIASTNLLKRILSQDPRISVEEAIRFFRELPANVSNSASTASAV